MYANLLYITVPLPLPMSAILILVTDLGYELFLALSYAWDSPESKTGLMKLPPRKPVSEASIQLTLKQQARGKVGFVQKIKDAIFDEREEDTLVDSDVLFWSYMEAGTIMTIGCLISYFYAMYHGFGITPADAVNYGSVWGLADAQTFGDVVLASGRTLSVQEQIDAVGLGQSAYYLTLMIQQSFNLFCCKARLGLPIGAFMFKNPRNFLGILVGAAITFAIVYIPPLNIAFGTNWQTTPWVWLIAMASGTFLFFYSILRVMVQRARNPIKYSKDVAGLDLHPTRWSTGR